MSSIVIENISKNFGSVKALNHINLELTEHKIYGLLGRNGAGKTTLLNLINNRLFPSEGQILFDGINIENNSSIQNQFYFIGEKSLYPDSMKVKALYKYTKMFHPDFDETYAYKLSEMFGVPLKKKLSSLSTGYKSIVKNIVALSVNVPFVFFDEPILGLDANHRELFYKVLIEKYIDQPATYVLSTHLIEEVSNIIEEVIIIKNGEVIKNESKEALLDNGYSISGPTGLVESYCSGKELIGFDTLGGLRSAYIVGKPDENIPQGLELSGMDLQKLFIQLTNI
ncbi:ABC-2 type transport system ATP-binding protein [Aequitasia blattaphilus]|uniref:ABC transporter ATP-binding protein n=1 Tax=Aequitasia blattaphilus TaxID=2949332 RepID=A0ABT1EB80_9FIRM|nr:ABC transporter ATP-binding protein [Aequitasia blattaphilus]MCP1103096.1 ABC transporter ATP-binding protein [Aequitasia blattaphilus]MCR8615736.1 ABC transporter ATP-binding protein [Aequitasia blattaphilus]